MKGTMKECIGRMKGTLYGCMDDYQFMTWGGEAVGHSPAENNIPSWDGKLKAASGGEFQGTHLTFQACLVGQEGTAYHIRRVEIVDMAEAPEWCWGVQSASKQRSGHPNGKKPHR